MLANDSLRTQVFAVAVTVLFLPSDLFGQGLPNIQTSDAQFRIPQLTFEAAASARSRTIVRENPDVGGGIVGVVNPNGNIVVTGIGRREVSGIEISSRDGLLRPIPVRPGEPGPVAGPFDAVLANTSSQITLASPTAPVGIAGSVELGVGYVGNSPETDVTAVWGRIEGEDVSQVPFPIVIPGTPSYSPFNLSGDGEAIGFEDAIYVAALEAGSAGLVPADSPANRVDPNIGGQFPGVGSLEVVHPTLGTFICTGSVIDDTHVLTAAHCFDQDNDGSVDPGIVAGSSFHLNDGGSPSSTTGIASVAIHPDFNGFSTGGAHDDLAVVTLASIVPPGTTKYAMRATGMSSHEVIEMVGHGISGFGDVGGVEVLPDFNVKRTGSNEADLFVVDDEGSGFEELFLYDFDGPSGTGVLGGATLGNDVETTVRGGDSGGPAFVQFAGQRVIGGVNTFEFILSGVTAPSGEFGVLGGGVIIDIPQFAWISSIAGGVRLLPEPSGISMLLTSSLVLGAFRRRRRVKK